MEYEALFVRALIITVLIECGVAAVLKRTAARCWGAFLKLARIGWPRLIFTVALATCLTLPYVWFVLPAFLPHGPVYAVSAELFAFIVEALWYSLALSSGHEKFNIKSAIILSAVSNAASFLIGILLF